MTFKFVHKNNVLKWEGFHLWDLDLINLHFGLYELSRCGNMWRKMSVEWPCDFKWGRALKRNGSALSRISMVICVLALVILHFLVSVFSLFYHFYDGLWFNESIVYIGLMDE